MSQLSSLRAFALVSAFAFAGACNQTPVQTPTRSFDGPTDAAITCAIYNPTKLGYDPILAQWDGVYEPLALSECRTLQVDNLRTYPNPDFPDDPTEAYYPVLRIEVANSARGEVALVDVANETLYDLDRTNPGYGFIPVGANPQGIRASQDGCLAVTANAGSCDLSVLDLTTMYNMAFITAYPGQPRNYAQDVVRRIQMYAGGKLLQARPTAIELTNQIEHPSGDLSCHGGSYHAWVALPGCGAVVEVELQLYGTVDPIPAAVIRALQLTPSGVQAIDPASLSCPAECTGAELGDLGASSLDLSTPLDGGTRLPVGLSAPGTITYDNEDQTSRLAIGDLYGERVSMITLDPITGEPGQPRSVKLETGALGVTRVRISPRSPAGKFLYAVAQDGSVRVIDLDREVECETNPDPTAFQTVPELDPAPRARALGCLPLGDPATPRRAPGNISPGIELPGGALGRDVAFVHLDTPVPVNAAGDAFSAQPVFMVGDFAWVFGSDGHATVINIYDACPQPNDSQTPDDGQSYTPACILSNAIISRVDDYSSNFGSPFPIELDRVSHRIRNGERRFQQPGSSADTFGTPRIQDASAGNRVTVTVQGSPAKAAAGARLPDLEAVNRLDKSLAAGGFTGANIVLDFPDPERARDENWSLTWEGAIPGTNRAFGTLCGSGNASCPRGALVDVGGGYCSHGVLPRDKVELVGCTHDKECLYSQSCAHDPNAPLLVTNGMCLDKDSQDARITRCSPLLRAQRRYRINPKQGVTLPSGQVADLLEMSEIYEPEFASETHTCAADIDCMDVTVQSGDPLQAARTLTTSCLLDTDGEKRCLLGCDPASANGSLCGEGYLCAQTDTSQPSAPDYRCMRAPLDLGLLNDCMPQSFPQRYQVRVGDAFIVNGTQSGFLFEDEPDPVTGVCEAPPISSERVRLRNPRIPLDVPLCPQQIDATKGIDAVSWVPAPGPNVCHMLTNDSDLLIHFQNEILSFALRLAQNGTSYVPPDYTIVDFIAVGGGFPLGLTMSVPGTQAAQSLNAAVVAPDNQTVFVVDEGKGAAGSAVRGQLFRLVSSLQRVDTTFIVH